MAADQPTNAELAAGLEEAARRIDAFLASVEARREARRMGREPKALEINYPKEESR